MLKVNLQPKVTLEVKEGFRMPLWPAILLGLIVAFGSGYTFWHMHKSRLFAESRIKQYDFKLRDFKKTLEEYETANNDKDYLQGKRDFVDSISQNQKQWIGFFDQLKARMPKDVWLTRFEGMRSGAYNIDGATFSFGSIGFFMIEMKSIPYITTVTLDNATSRGSTGGKTAIDAIAKTFKLTGDMKLAALDEAKAATATVQTPAAPATR